MKKTISLFVLFLVLVTGTFAQKVGPYKVTGIQIIPFDGNTGKFSDPLGTDERGGYFNDLDKSILAIIEITGPAGEFAEKRGVSIRVTEGKKVKLSKIDYPGVINENGKFYMPVFLYPAMCDQVTITASITGQTQRSSMKRQLDFMCGE